RNAGTFMPDDHRLMVGSGQSLYAVHVIRLIASNERTTDEQKKRVGCFVFHNDQWWLVNEGLSGLISLPDRKTVGIGEQLHLDDNTMCLLPSEVGERLVVVQLLNN
ncbi:kinase, partial [Klebsiella pneumoniae]